MVLSEQRESAPFLWGTAVHGSKLRLVTVAAVAAAACIMASASLASGAARPLQSSASDRAAHVTSTRVHRVSPLNASGHLSSHYTVARVRRGYCWTSSSIRPDLYRCFRGNLIVDPCWPAANRASVLCIVRPWSHRVLRLRLTRGLPQTFPGASRGWGLTLPSGNNCLFSSGAHDQFHGHTILYYCRRNWVLLDEPDQSQSSWTIRTARREGDHYVARGIRPLTDAWRAKGP